MYLSILITFFFVPTIFAASIDQVREKVNYQVIILKKGFPSCYGTILNSKLVLTVSQCVYGTKSNQLEVEVDILKSTAEKQEGEEGGIRRPEDEFAYFDRFYKVESIKTHELSGYKQHDFSYLKLQSEIKFNKFVSPVKLPQPNSTIPSEAVTYGFATVKDKNIPDRSNFEAVQIHIETKDNVLLLKGKVTKDNVQRVKLGTPVTTSDGVLVGILYNLRSTTGELQLLNIQKASN